MWSLGSVGSQGSLELLGYTRVMRVLLVRVSTIIRAARFIGVVMVIWVASFIRDKCYSSY